MMQKFEFKPTILTGDTTKTAPRINIKSLPLTLGPNFYQGRIPQS